MDHEIWYGRAVQAEFILGNLRGIPNISVDRLMGVPEEVIEAEEAARLVELRKAQAKKITGGRGHRKPGEQAPVDPKQREQFFSEVQRWTNVNMLSDMPLPPPVAGKINLNPDEDFEPESLIRKQQK